jgi:methylmalonyl-CoA/ethylmalonyl-CoA epimerase
MLGVRHFTTLPVNLGPPDFRCHNQPAEISMDLGFGYIGETQLELIQSRSDGNIYPEFLRRKGPGLHHVGFVVEDYNRAVN